MGALTFSDPGAALMSAPQPGAYLGVDPDQLDRFARSLVKHAAASGSWLMLTDHLAAIKAAANQAGARE